VLAGRYAGRKAVVVKTHEDGSDGKRFGYAIGIILVPVRLASSAFSWLRACSSGNRQVPPQGHESHEQGQDYQEE
jgi:hypothetical protein